MTQTIQLKRTGTTTPPPSLLAPGELAVEIGAGPTRVWLGDGISNRLLISNGTGDQPVAGGNYVSKAGDTMTGYLVLVDDPRDSSPLDAATKQYVDNLVGSPNLYRGLYNPTTNTPDITLGDTVGGAYYIVSITGPMLVDVAGIPAGTPMTAGDRVIWSQELQRWEHFQTGGGLDKPTADATYVNVTGDTMTGNLNMQGPATVVLGAAPVGAMDAVPLSYLQSQLTGFLPLSGGIVTGPTTVQAALTLPLAPVSGTDAVNKAYVDSVALGGDAPNDAGTYGRLGPPSRTWRRAVAVTGDVMSGPLQMGASANLIFLGPNEGVYAPAPSTLLYGPWNPAPITFGFDNGTLRWKVGATDGGRIAGGNITSGGGGGGGIPEAPTDGRIYGRQGSTASWQPLLASVSTDDLPPASPVDGQMWWDSVAGQLFIWYDDPSSSQWVAATNIPNAVPSGLANDQLVYTSGAWTARRPSVVINGFTPGVMTPDQYLLVHRFGKAVTFPANFGEYLGHLSEASGTEAASNAITIQLRRSSAANPTVFTVIGTITISPGSLVGTFSTPSGTEVNFAQGDTLAIVGPTAADAAFRNFAVTLAGWET